MTDALKQLNKDIVPIAEWLPQGKGGPGLLPWVIAGPCSAESAEQMLTTARGLATSPHVKAFAPGSGSREPGLTLSRGSAKWAWTGWPRSRPRPVFRPPPRWPTSTTSSCACAHGVDILWIGARTTVSPFSVQEIADALRGTDIPVFVKNPINAELGLWLGAIERLHDAGIRKLGAIHRGFSTYGEMQFRNDPKWQIPIELKRLLPDLPLICDPSHITGSRQLIEPVSQMAMDLGIQGLIIESHIDPDRALSDAKQQVTPEELCRMLERLKVRNAAITDREVKRKIAQFRAEISQVDARIIQDLAERMKWVEEIGRLKHEHNIPVLQIERWENLLGDHIARGQKAGLDAEFIKALFELIHAQAVKRQL